MMEKQKRELLTLTPVVVCLALLPVLKPDIYYLSALFSIFLYAALACGWNIFGGYTGYMNFGHASFFGVGAYTSALLLLRFGLSPFYTLILGGALAGVLAAVIGYPCLRLRGPYFVLVTFCLGLAARIVVINAEWTGSSTGLWLPFLKVSMFVNRVIFYEVMLAIMVLTILVAMWVERSKFGIGLRAIFQDEDSAETQGVNATKLKIAAFIVSAFLAGIAGSIYGYYRSYIHPDFIFDVSISVLVVLMALLGGRQSWVGPVIGAAIVVLINEVLTAYVGIGAEFSRIIYGLLLVIVIMYLPNGLIGLSPHRFVGNLRENNKETGIGGNINGEG
jgi:branched-chain amino acid transport system permease protein